jgi:hypothetical protein
MSLDQFSKVDPRSTPSTSPYIASQYMNAKFNNLDVDGTFSNGSSGSSTFANLTVTNEFAYSAGAPAANRILTCVDVAGDSQWQDTANLSTISCQNLNALNPGVCIATGGSIVPLVDLNGTLGQDSSVPGGPFRFSQVYAQEVGTAVTPITSMDSKELTISASGTVSPDVDSTGTLGLPTAAPGGPLKWLAVYAANIGGVADPVSDIECTGINVQAGGTGITNLNTYAAGGDLYALTDNAYDLGVAPAARFKDCNLAGNINAAGGSILGDLKTHNVVPSADATYTIGSAAGPLAYSSAYLNSVVLGSGGSALGSALNWYKEDTQANTYQGIWAAPQAAVLRIVRTGSWVSIWFPAATAAATVGTFISCSASLPADYVPNNAAPTSFPVCVEDNGAIQTSPGRCVIGIGGSVSIYLDYSTANFTGAGVSGIASPFCVQYPLT